MFFVIKGMSYRKMDVCFFYFLCLSHSFTFFLSFTVYFTNNFRNIDAAFCCILSQHNIRSFPFHLNNLNIQKVVFNLQNLQQKIILIAFLTPRKFTDATNGIGRAEVARGTRR